MHRLNYVSKLERCQSKIIEFVLRKSTIGFVIVVGFMHSPRRNADLVVIAINILRYVAQSQIFDLGLCFTCRVRLAILVFKRAP